MKEVRDTKLANPTGHFGSMVANPGWTTARRIVNIARQAYYKDSPNERQIEIEMWAVSVIATFSGAYITISLVNEDTFIIIN